ncbi:MAG TPA: methionine ABC transporter ATP-binding protein [Pseudonocardiaceae bacterium]|jgi:D-methionine transport system ATP-binding protein|nr:methionine ABC transporter ATP-binding protein [Pseudonocardiaceae bacterium]
MITVENLTKSFTGHTGSIVALDDVTLDVPDGTLFGVVGPAGAGKSTLARCVALQERPDRGAIRVGGTNLMALSSTQLRQARRQLSLLPPDRTLLGQRTAAGNIALPLEQAGVAGPNRRAKVAELLDLAGLNDRAGDQLDSLSAGQRRRVAVARALASGATVLLADEPTSGLDTAESCGVLTVLDRARAELGVTVLLVTRDAGVIRRACDDVAVLDGGRVVERGSLLDLASDLDSWTAGAVLPAVHADLTPAARRALTAGYDRVADLVLIGFATIGALLPEAASRFGAEISVVGGGLTRLGDTPVARFQVGLTGERADSALAWIADRGAVVHQTPRTPRIVAA